MKPRHQFYLDAANQQDLDRLSRAPGATRSSIVNAALRSYFAARGAGELERMFRIRLERMSESLDRLERNQHIGLESFALFVRYELGVTPQLPPGENAAAQAIRRDRFQHFIEQVGRRMAGDKRIARDVADHAVAVSAQSCNSERLAAE